MGGHGHHDSGHGQRVNEHNIKESDSDMSSKIRPIDLIKYNPNLFHVWIYDLSQISSLLGGLKTDACIGLGGAFGYYYYSLRTQNIPDTFYIKNFRLFSRVFLGAVVGGAIGFLKFGDRQRVHNAWVAERLRRRYPESMNLDTHDLWKYKGIKPNNEFYRWT